jgi:hypothetical protein
MKRISQVHVSTIRMNDIVIHNGVECTVGKNDIKHNTFMGSVLFGDSHKLGHTLVTKVTWDQFYKGQLVK